MTILAILLLGLGAADLARPIDARARKWVLVRSLAIGAVVIGMCWWGTGLSWWWGVGLLVLLAAWVVLTPWLGGAIPVVGLGVVVLGLVALDGRLPTAHGWMPDQFAAFASGPIAAATFTHVALAVGLIAFLVDTANIVVRLVLQATDSRALGSAPSLRGGRVLRWSAPSFLRWRSAANSSPSQPSSPRKASSGFPRSRKTCTALRPNTFSSAAS
jgi:hypothetical protein